ncbi:MAG: LysM peptidoglycan-binding domain-containing protein [Bacteroidota bacterium]
MASKHIVKVKEYKVADGDSIKSIAEANGMTWEELSRFNWGTDNPDEINKHLRSDVGCFKRTENDKNFVFTSKDDPGIVYIPQEFPDTAYPADASHTITVKRVVRKTFIPSKVMVHFRPKADWKGEYGFDWLRIKNDVLITETDYDTAIEGGYNGTKAGMTKAQAYTQLKTEYGKGANQFKTEVKDEAEYFVPYLHLYPQAKPGDPPPAINPAPFLQRFPPFEAELRMRITVEDEEPLLIEFEYNKNLFKLNRNTIDEKAIARRKNYNTTIKITCLEEFDTDQEIKVLAYPKTWKLDDPIPIAGKIIVGANSKRRRMSVKFVFVNVKTDVQKTGAPTTGSYASTPDSAREVDNLYNTLFQCFFDHETEVAPDLDLSGNPDFKNDGKFAGPTGLLDHALGMKPVVRKLFLDVKDGAGMLINAKYKDTKIFTVFSFNEPNERSVIGAIEDIGIRNLVLFSSRDATTLNHEVLHGFGLHHTHKDGDFEKVRKYTYPNALTDSVNCTDNVMSYNPIGLTTWNWQWEILKSING